MKISRVHQSQVSFNCWNDFEGHILDCNGLISVTGRRLLECLVILLAPPEPIIDNCLAPVDLP